MTATVVQRECIILEIVRRCDAMGMQFAGMATVWDRNYELKTGEDPRPYMDMWGLIIDPGVVTLPPGRKLPTEEHPQRYNSLLFTIGLDWWRNCQRFEVVVYPRNGIERVLRTKRITLLGWNK